MLGANATNETPKEPPTRPMTIQGRRMPSRKRCGRSICRRTDCPPWPLRRRLGDNRQAVGVCSMPTSELTFKAKVTSRGATSTRTVPRYANVYSEMKPVKTNPLYRRRPVAQRGLRRGSIFKSVQPGGGWFCWSPHTAPFTCSRAASLLPRNAYVA